MKSNTIARLLLATSFILIIHLGYAQHRWPATHKTIDVGGYSIFYREAGDPGKATIVLLHGFPSTSHMYRDLINDLADQYHVIAPDYIGNGQSDAPSPQRFSYTFDAIAAHTQYFLEKIGVSEYTLYMFDIGGPIGFRIAVNDPGKVRAIIIQNTTVYQEGFSTSVAKPVLDYTNDPNPETEKAARIFFQLPVIKSLYVDWAADAKKISPDGYLLDYAHVNQEGTDAILLALLRNYKSNFPFFLKAREYLRKYKPQLLLISGKRDQIFPEAGNAFFAKDDPNTQLSPIDGGHFLLEEKHKEASVIIKEFLKSRHIK